MQPLKKYLPNILIIVFLAFGVFASVGDANAAQKEGDGVPFIQLSPGEAATGLNPDDVWLTWANYEATEFWKYSYCIATDAQYAAGACQTGDPNWTGTYNRKYVHLTNLQPNTDYKWRVKVVKCEKKDCTEKSHIVSHSNVFTFTTSDDDWLKISGRAGTDSGILVNFYDYGDFSAPGEKIYSIMTGNKGYYTISVPNGFYGIGYPRLNPEEWTIDDPLFDTRFMPTYINYTENNTDPNVDYSAGVILNLTEQNFVIKSQIFISGHTDGIMNVPIVFEYGDDTDLPLYEAYSFTTYSDEKGFYKQAVPKNWYGSVTVGPFEGVSPYAPYDPIDETNFDPETYSVPQLTDNKTGLNFYLDFVKISGHTDNLPGVEITFTGVGEWAGTDYSAISDEDGYYFYWVEKGWQGTVAVETPFDYDGTTYYYSPQIYSLPQVFDNTYGWSFFKTKIDPSP